jgi:hypothetical protein
MSATATQTPPWARVAGLVALLTAVLALLLTAFA